MEVQVDLHGIDAELGDLGLSLADDIEAVQDCSNQLTGLGFNVGPDAERLEWLLYAILSEDVWELGVDLHVEEDFFAD